MPSGSRFPNIVQTISVKWKELPAEGREKYVKAFARDKQQRAAALLVSDLIGFGPQLITLLLKGVPTSTTVALCSHRTQFWNSPACCGCLGIGC